MLKDTTYLGLKDQFYNTEHHKTLTELYDWSYNELSAEEQALFRRLAVFGCGCCFHAAEEICSLNADLSDVAIVNSANKLNFHKLIRYQDDWLEITHKTIRDYALNKLREKQQEEHEVHKQHRNYYLKLAKLAFPNLLSEHPDYSEKPEGITEDWLPENIDPQWPEDRLIGLPLDVFKKERMIAMWFIAWTGTHTLLFCVNPALLKISLVEHDNFYEAMKWTLQKEGADGWETYSYLRHIWYMPISLASKLDFYSPLDAFVYTEDPAEKPKEVPIDPSLLKQINLPMELSDLYQFIDQTIEYNGYPY